MSADVARHFSQDYREARARFGAAAQACDLELHSHVHPMPGRDGEELAVDVVCDGPADAESLLVISSGCHGVEGYCGSGVQLALLADPAWRTAAREAGVSVLYVHAINPYGFSWWRRVTEENVDLNRNFHDFTRPLPANPGYDALAPYLVPDVERWPPPLRFKLAIAWFRLRRGRKALQAAVSAGQHEHPRGLFFGGREPTWSNRTIRRVLREHGARCAKLGWIDLHTGLGPNGHAERILACREDEETVRRVRDWWGQDVTSTSDGSSVSADVTGNLWQAAYEECPQAQITGIVVEYGTEPLMKVSDALRAEQWLENHPRTGEEQRRAIKRGLRDAFYTDTDDWKRRVVEQARDAAHDALRGLADGDGVRLARGG